MILMNDFKAEPAEIRLAMLSAVQRVLESGWYILGNEVTAFEQQWASVCGVSHAVGMANGMDAIEIALRALDVGVGDEVITTPITAFATVLAIMRAGATPVLADIDPHTALMSLESARRCISLKTKAIILVHLYGQVRAMLDWGYLCEQYNIALIEDCAQAHLAAWQDGIAGSFGSAGAYSFYPTKNLGAPGDAGMLVTTHATIAERAARIRNYGQSERYHHTEIGVNSRLDEIQAAMLSERLKWLDAFTKRRQQTASTYREAIHHWDVSVLAPPEHESAHVYHMFVVRCTHREALQKHLQACGVQTLIHYPVPVHLQEPCRRLKRDSMGLSNSEMHASHCLSLPCHPQLSDHDIMSVIEAINSFKI